MKSFKHLLLAGYFLVSWNEHYLKYHQVWKRTEAGNNGGVAVNWQEPGYYTVEVATKAVRLATQNDVDLFIGTREWLGWYIGDDNKTHHEYKETKGIISKDSFNIEVEKIIAEDQEFINKGEK